MIIEKAAGKKAAFFVLAGNQQAVNRFDSDMYCSNACRIVHVSDNQFIRRKLITLMSNVNKLKNFVLHHFQCLHKLATTRSNNQWLLKLIKTRE
jgi:hypothetical protein